MDYLPQLYERINNDQISLAINFNHGLSSIGLHYQLEKILLNIKIPCWKNIKNMGIDFPYIRV